MLRLLLIPILFMINSSVNVYDFKVPSLDGGTIDLVCLQRERNY